MTTFVKTTDTYRPGSRTMPGRYYTAPEIYQEEAEKIFGEYWHCVGRESQIAQPGDYYLQDLAGESLIIVRDRSGMARAFYNVCRHRGTRLCEEHQGRFSETIQCPYHAWTYGLDGRLLGAPHMADAVGFDKMDYPLHEAAIDSWEGFLFVSLGRKPKPLPESLGPLVGRFGRFSLPGLRPGGRREYDTQANWKLIFQNYSECLHCPMIHPGLARISPYLSGTNDLYEGASLGGHMLLNEGIGSLTMSGRSCGLPVGHLPTEDMNRVYYYSIFPNLLLSLHPDYVMFHTVWPRGPGRTRIICEWLFNPASFETPGFDPNDAVSFWDMTNQQDWHICEQSQAGQGSRRYTSGPYSPRESVPAAWDSYYLDVMGHRG